MALRLVAVTRTDTGLQREQNEDACYAQVGEGPQQASGIFIVADGMGGYHAGEVASRLAVETIRDALQPLLGPASAQPTMRLGRRKRAKATAATAENGASPDGPVADEGDGPGADAAPTTADVQGASPTRHLAESLAMEHFGERLRAAIEQSGEVIVEYGREHTDAQGLGSTVTAALVIDGQAYIANVGDSRTYLLRDGELQQITRDHSLVARLVEAGQIEPDEAYEHPNRNLIYRSLGAGRAEVDVDIFAETLQAGDTLLLCSDGLWEMVHDPEIAGMLSEPRDLAHAAEALVAQANRNGGEDNITAVLVRCDAG
jgi:protein phosphatase